MAVEPRTVRRRLFELLESGNRFRRGARIADGALTVLIIANVAAVAAETIEPLYRDHRALFDAFDAVSVALFTVEYLARLWVCVEHAPLQRQRPWSVRVRFAFSAYMVIDLLAILPSYLLAAGGADLRALRVFRLIRLLKLARHSTGLATLGRVLNEERRALGAALVIMAGLLLFSASGIYFIERAVQPQAFGSIPAALWWALSTLSTVGYGDVVPVTPLGKVFGGLVTLLGIGVYALPVGIIAAGFRNEFQRRDFVVSWGMVASVPVFAGLDPVSVGKIARLLHSRVVPPHYAIVRRGEAADAVYFIVAGRAEVLLPGGAVSLGEGDFFGEIGLLYDTTRTATVVARTECRLMVLEVHDFQRLLEDNPRLREGISQVAERRVREQGWHLGDLAPEELAPPGAKEPEA